MANNNQYTYKLLLTLVAVLAIAIASIESATLSSREDSASKPDIFIGWMNNPALSQFKPLFSQIQQQVSPTTEQMTSQILDNVPGAKQAYEQMAKLQEQFGSLASGSLNPSQIFGQNSNGNSNGKS